MPKTKASFTLRGASAVATDGGGGGVPFLTAACVPHFSLLKTLLLEHYITIRQQTMMEKRINSRLTFQILCAIAGIQLLYINLTQ